jgi:histidinol-phosphate aminotransferase
MFGGEPVQIPIRTDLAVDLDLAMKVCRTAKVLFLANPNQPTGMLIDTQGVIELVRRAAATDAVVVVDEAYFPFSRVTVIDAVGTYPNLAVLRTFSKAYGLAGVRLGFVAAASPLVKAIYKVRSAYDVNSFAVLCADYFLDHREIVDDYVHQVWRSAEWLQALARTYGLEAPETATNFQLIKTAPRFNPKQISDSLRRLGYVIRGPVDSGAMKDYIRVTLGEFDIIRRFGDVLDSTLQAMTAGVAVPLAGGDGR